MRNRVAALVAAGALLATGCTGDEPVRVLPGGGPVRAPVINFPSQIVGLTVTPEDVSKVVEEVRRPYVDSLAVFSLREEELLRATLQISRFNRLAKPREGRFRGSILQLLGSSRPLELRVGDQVVYSTSGNRQDQYIWFTDEGFFVLSVHQDYSFPRTLLRRVVEQDIQL
ncbi:MAG TPA: hypothetical protein VM840_11585 [Actinomycetota bacterium]|nr:hypothetical protein [Actinomycetota bacterium]